MARAVVSRVDGYQGLTRLRILMVMNTEHSAERPPNAIETSFVVGTAGHVDHGKSTLVRALTGIDPDRLAEEKDRQLTIDLGFAWLTLPDGRTVSLVDVPGHERFVRNMLAGVGGIDMALLVIAADDGPMPQTREHLAILDLLGVERGVVAVSRVDLVDTDWCNLVVEEVHELLQDTSLAESPVVAISAITGEGMDELLATISAQLAHARSRDSSGRPRLNIDRAFQMPGFGTVVTGTLLDGELRVGQEVMIYPREQRVRIRGIQTHQRQVEHVQSGSRVAVNLAGVDHGGLGRGDVLASPGGLRASMRVDARISILDDAPTMLEQNAEVMVFVGTAEVPARVTLLDRDKVGPGEQGWVQLRLAQPLAVMRGDRLILRRPSPATTIGGGAVVDPRPMRHRRFREDVIEHLAVLAEGTPEDFVLQHLGDRAVEIADLATETGVQDVHTAVQHLLEAGDIAILTAGVEANGDTRSAVVRSFVLERWVRDIQTLLTSHHAEHPLSSGVRRDDIRALTGIRSPRVFDAVMAYLEQGNVLRSNGAIVTATDFEIELNPQLRAMADTFLAAARASPYSPASPAEMGLPDDLVLALESRGELVRVGEAICYPAEVFDEIRARVLDKLERDRTLSLAEYRDMFETSRKYAQPTLEHLDELRITRRTGDVRVKGRGASSAEQASAQST